jgi:hypothetical protein
MNSPRRSNVTRLSLIFIGASLSIVRSTHDRRLSRNAAGAGAEIIAIYEFRYIAALEIWLGSCVAFMSSAAPAQVHSKWNARS